MHGVRARTAGCLSARHLTLAPFPVTARRRVRGMGAILAVALLPSLIAGFSCRACAEP
jgi:hypothetical protein